MQEDSQEIDDYYYDYDNDNDNEMSSIVDELRKSIPIVCSSLLISMISAFILIFALRWLTTKITWAVIILFHGILFVGML